jgi:hypothetical protein
MDKAQFVELLGRILTHTSWGITGAKYEKDGWIEVASIEFGYRDPLRVNITSDSNAMIILDVMRALEEQIGF